MNHITIELCAEDRARLDAILEALQKAAPRCDNCVKLVTDICATKDAPENNAQEPEEVTPKQTQPEPKKPTQATTANEAPAPEVTVEDLRSKYMRLATTDGKEKARQIVKEYAPKLNDIPADKRAEVLDKLTALEG